MRRSLNVPRVCSCWHPCLITWFGHCSLITLDFFFFFKKTALITVGANKDNAVCADRSNVKRQFFFLLNAVKILQGRKYLFPPSILVHENKWKHASFLLCLSYRRGFQGAGYPVKSISLTWCSPPLPEGLTCAAQAAFVSPMPAFFC